jgi:hypothetical protein
MFDYDPFEKVSSEDVQMSDWEEPESESEKANSSEELAVWENDAGATIASGRFESGEWIASSAGLDAQDWA